MFDCDEVEDLKILNNKINLQPLPGSVNASKGANVNKGLAAFEENLKRWLDFLDSDLTHAWDPQFIRRLTLQTLADMGESARWLQEYGYLNGGPPPSSLIQFMPCHEPARLARHCVL